MYIIWYRYKSRGFQDTSLEAFRTCKMTWHLRERLSSYPFVVMDTHSWLCRLFLRWLIRFMRTRGMTCLSSQRCVYKFKRGSHVLLNNRELVVHFPHSWEQLLFSRSLRLREDQIDYTKYYIQSFSPSSYELVLTPQQP